MAHAGKAGVCNAEPFLSVKKIYLDWQVCTKHFISPLAWYKRTGKILKKEKQQEEDLPKNIHKARNEENEQRNKQK